jgi:site-specific DNA-adenine methylase
MSHFLINYAGNKRSEYELIKPFMNHMTEEKTIFIEPFCGSCDISFNIFMERGYKKDDLYVLNDISPLLYKLLMTLKNESVEKIKENVDAWRLLMLDKENYNRIKKENPNDLYVYIVINHYYSIREGLYPEPSKPGTMARPFNITKKKQAFIDFIKNDNVILYNKDWVEVFDMYKDNKNALIIMDPPYLMSCNSFYDSAYASQLSKNVYEYFFINSKKKFKSTVYFILEHVWIIQLLFNGREVHTYDKLYQVKKKKTTHCIIKW